MGSQAGGKVRFRGPGSQWKSSWKGRPQFSQICCVGDFAADTEGQFYENTNGPLDITPALGWFLGFLVVVREVPTGTAVIARNGSVADEGWLLFMFDDSVAAGEPAVGFTLVVYDGVGPAATVSVGLLLLRNLESVGGGIAFSLLAAFEPPNATFPDGRAILASAQGTFAVGMSAPYVNTSPSLLVGREGVNAFEQPNCISGLVGGTAPWTEASAPTEVEGTLSLWDDLLLAANGLVPVPNSVLPGLVNTNGWRVGVDETPLVAAPNPFPDFIDAEPLDYGNVLPDARDLTIDCMSPFLLYPANLEFPFGN